MKLPRLNSKYIISVYSLEFQLETQLYLAKRELFPCFVVS